MRPSDDITRLAQEIHERRGGRTLILFLGAACARAAGAPDALGIARMVFADEDLSQLYLENTEEHSDEDLLDAFNEFLEEMTTGQRYRMLQSFYDGIPVPTFYQDLALLIKAGYFRQILTTSIDGLLEGALNGAGLFPERDYQVITLGRAEELPWRRKNRKGYDMFEAPLHLVKLHGDLAQRQVALTPDEISDALEPQRAFVKGELSGDLLVVGYEFESEPLNKWLSWTPGDVWWVNTEAPEAVQIEPIEARRSVKIVDGDQAHPEAFFSQLSYVLLRGEQVQMRYMEDENGQIYASVKGGEILDEATAESENVYSDLDYLQSQLRRSQAILSNLEQSLAPGEANVRLQAQIDYQRSKVVELEEQLLDLESNRERVVKLLNQVREALNNPDTDPHAMSFIQVQVQSVEAEYQREHPNQSIVSAAIGATVVLAERLGKNVVDPKLVHDLAAFAPSAFGRMT